jgi:hypothetical protein
MRLEGALMEPEQPSEATRPKGFVRRNWGVLTLCACTLPLFLLKAHVSGPTGFHHYGYVIGVYDGKVLVSFLPKWLLPENAWDILIEAPRSIATFPAVVQHEHAGVYGVTAPLWVLLSLFTAWIAFREWRRHRAAKGKA